MTANTYPAALNPPVDQCDRLALKLLRQLRVGCTSVVANSPATSNIVGVAVYTVLFSFNDDRQGGMRQ
jgi:hypothetical protein